ASSGADVDTSNSITSLARNNDSILDPIQSYGIRQTLPAREARSARRVVRGRRRRERLAEVAKGP
ncbi:MAG: hypothetical protein, partial [Olavius algarvensis Gamma 1 endosymbiont]